MYIIKNALRCISRSKGRNVLIGIIVLVIAISACIGLSIKQAAHSAREKALENLSVTATISFDRQSMMSEMSSPPNMSGGDFSFDKDAFKDMMGNSSSLSLDEYKTYATAESVKDFYYSMSVSANETEGFEAITNETDDESDNNSSFSSGFGGMFGGFGGGFGGGKGGMSFGARGDFQIVGYSGESAMTDFLNGNITITDGEVFEEGTLDYDCLISSELATYNGLEVGNTVSVQNPSNEDEAYTLIIVGIYESTASNEGSFSFGGASDPANTIYMSYNALENIVNASEETVSALESTKTEDGDEISAISGSLNATYSFADVESYEAFEGEVRNLGLSEDYTVSSQDITAFENSLTPLETLSTMAGWFLLVILIIGAIILVVLNIFNVRERKYEIGVLTAMGMKKMKVAAQFLTEIFAVTLCAVIIGAVIGGVSSVPVTNVLLENQISSQSQRNDRIENNFGRGDKGENMGQIPTDVPQMPSGGMGGGRGGMGGFFEEIGRGTANYVTEINSAMNLTVVLQMLGIAILLTLIAGAVSMLFVMRYEPLKILSNRD